MSLPKLPDDSFYVRHSMEFVMRRDFRRLTERELPEALPALLPHVLILDVSGDREAALFVRGFFLGREHFRDELAEAS